MISSHPEMDKAPIVSLSAVGWTCPDVPTSLSGRAYGSRVKGRCQELTGHPLTRLAVNQTLAGASGTEMLASPSERG